MPRSTGAGPLIPGTTALSSELQGVELAKPRQYRTCVTVIRASKYRCVHYRIRLRYPPEGDPIVFPETVLPGETSRKWGKSVFFFQYLPRGEVPPG